MAGGTGGAGEPTAPAVRASASACCFRRSRSPLSTHNVAHAMSAQHPNKSQSMRWLSSADRPANVQRARYDLRSTATYPPSWCVVGSSSVVGSVAVCRTTSNPSVLARNQSTIRPFSSGQMLHVE